MSRIDRCEWVHGGRRVQAREGEGSAHRAAVSKRFFRAVAHRSDSTKLRELVAETMPRDPRLTSTTSTLGTTGLATKSNALARITEIAVSVVASPVRPTMGTPGRVPMSRSQSATIHDR
jgi:hypothetical protein